MQTVLQIFVIVFYTIHKNMWGKMIKHKKNGFTLAEVLAVCTVFAIIVLAIIGAISRAYSFMGNIRLKVRATNFAREGVEMMYNIRDTNRRKCSGKKDANWLSLGTGGSNCDPDANNLFSGGLYVLKEGVSQAGDWYIYAEKFNLENSMTITGVYERLRNSSNANSAKIQFTGNYFYSTGNYNQNNVWELQVATGDMKTLLGGETDFYRLVRVYGVYCKNGNSPEITSSCNNSSDPKEMRFCVKVFYKGNGEHTSELCSIMTNFEK